MAMAHEAGVRWWESGMLAELAALELRAGRLAQAEEQARQSLRLAEEIGDRAGRILGVGLLAGVAAAAGQQERALRLWTAVVDEEAVAPLGGWRRHRSDVEARIGCDAATAPPDTRERPLPLDAAVTLALGDGRACDRRAPRNAGRGSALNRT
jgi:hypothetical protein